MLTTFAFIHLQVFVRVAGNETIELDFQQRALRELEEAGLVGNVHPTRPFSDGSPRLRADLTDDGRMARDELLKALGARSR